MHHAIAAVITLWVMLEGFWSIDANHPTFSKFLIVGYVVYGLIVVARKSRKAGR